MYTVIKDFTDLEDNRHVYLEGDIYPRKGVKASEERVDELISTNNRRGVALIKEIEEKPKTKKSPKKAKKKE